MYFAINNLDDYKHDLNEVINEYIDQNTVKSIQYDQYGDIELQEYLRTMF